MNRLKELREEAMMTVRELSEHSGVSEDTITKIENGHRKGRGMTLRKLAKALGTRPYQLFPEDFERETGAEERSPDILPQDSLFGSEIASANPPETKTQGTPTLAKLLRALEVVNEVQVHSGAAYKDSLKILSERQRNVLTAVFQRGQVETSTVAEQLGLSVSTAYRDLSVLEEHGLVSRDESGKSRATGMGKGVAGVLVRGGFHFDEALRYIAIVMKAYESVARVEPGRLPEEEAQLYFWLQELVIQSISHIVSAAEAPPLAKEVREGLRASRPKREGAQDPATSVLCVMRNLTSKPPKITAIRSDIEGVPEERIYEALDAVSAAFRSGKGAADPYKNFVWNLKKPSRTRLSPTAQRSEVDRSQ